MSSRDVHHGSLALGDFARVPGRARKAVTRDVHPRVRRFARHKQIRIALSFTTQLGNTAGRRRRISLSFAEAFLPAVKEVDQLAISLQSHLFFPSKNTLSIFLSCRGSTLNQRYLGAAALNRRVN